MNACDPLPKGQKYDDTILTYSAQNGKTYQFDEYIGPCIVEFQSANCFAEWNCTIKSDSSDLSYQELVRTGPAGKACVAVPVGAICVPVCKVIAIPNFLTSQLTGLITPGTSPSNDGDVVISAYEKPSTYSPVSRPMTVISSNTANGADIPLLERAVPATPEMIAFVCPLGYHKTIWVKGDAPAGATLDADIMYGPGPGTIITNAGLFTGQDEYAVRLGPWEVLRLDNIPGGGGNDSDNIFGVWGMAPSTRRLA